MPFECKKYHSQCQARCCGIVPIQSSVWQRNQHKIQKEVKESRKVYFTKPDGQRYTGFLPVTADGLCPFLKKDLQCAIYEDRPEICKKFGDETHWALKCPMQHADGTPREQEDITELNSKVKDWIAKTRTKMRSRAKCKACQTIIESTEIGQYVLCKCGKIGVEGGEELFRAMFHSQDDFLIVDDEGNEIVPGRRPTDAEIKELSKDLAWEQDKDKIVTDLTAAKPTKSQILEMLDEMRKSYERLPEHARYAPVSHVDFIQLMLFISALFRCD